MTCYPQAILKYQECQMHANTFIYLFVSLLFVFILITKCVDPMSWINTNGS